MIILYDAVKKAILENGGKEEDIKFLENDEVLIEKIAIIAARKCVKIGNEERNGYEATAENDLRGSLIKFCHSNKELKVSGLCFKKNIENNVLIKIILINCRAKTKIGILEEISKRGYFFTPSPYLLGLMITHPELVIENSPIVSLDDENSFGSTNDSFLNFFKIKNGEVKKDGVCIGTTNPGMKFEGNWRFAVCKKEELDEQEKIIPIKEVAEHKETKVNKEGFFQRIFKK